MPEYRRLLRGAPRLYDIVRELAATLGGDGAVLLGRPLFEELQGLIAWIDGVEADPPSRALIPTMGELKGESK